MTSLQKNSAKFTAKKDACDEKSTHARNHYLLQLSAANAHQNHFFNMDLPEIIKAMECEIYQKLSAYMGIYSGTELLTAAAMQNSFTKLRDQSQNVSHNNLEFWRSW
jgi:hypothetical protein